MIRFFLNKQKYQTINPCKDKKKVRKKKQKRKRKKRKKKSNIKEIKKRNIKEKKIRKILNNSNSGIIPNRINPNNIWEFPNARTVGKKKQEQPQ